MSSFAMQRLNITWHRWRKTFDFENYPDPPGGHGTVWSGLDSLKSGLGGETLWQDIPGPVISALSHLHQDSRVFSGGVWAAHCHPAGSPGAAKWPKWKLAAQGRENNTAYGEHQMCPELGKTELESKAGWQGCDSYFSP